MKTVEKCNNIVEIKNYPQKVADYKSEIWAQWKLEEIHQEGSRYKKWAEDMYMQKCPIGFLSFKINLIEEEILKIDNSIKVFYTIILEVHCI